MSRRSLGVRAATAALLLAALLAVQAPPATPADEWTFVQVQRVNSLTLQYGTDAYATQNAFGGAFEGPAQASLQSALDSAVGDGSISLLLAMPGLTDLTGTNNPAFDVGIVNATPVQPAGNPTTYDGSSDLDWWYLPNDSDQLTAAFAAKTFDAGPGPVALDVNLAGVPTTLAMSVTRIQAVAGDASAPLDSTNGFPPGHEPEENLPDSLTSFESMSSGKLAGRISARSLANTLIPASLTGSNCTANYTVTHTLLDLLVSGCNFGGFLTLVSPTQPDTFDPAVGSGVYGFTTDAGKRVTGCTRNSVAATLDDCLSAAAYSSYFQFTTNRVIDRAQVSIRKVLTVSRTGSGSGAVTSAPAGIDCGADCSHAFESGSVVDLSAAAAAGSTFAGWSGGGCSGTGVCTVTMDAATSVEATFTADDPSGTGGSGDGGGATTTGGGGTSTGTSTDGGGTATAADTTPPVFGSATISPRKVRKRATATFSLSEAARVTFVFERVVPGRRVRSQCVKRTRANARKRPCRRFVPVARLTAAALAGANKKVFGTRIGRRTLTPGAYRLTLRATDAAGNRSQPKRLTFAVIRR